MKCSTLPFPALTLSLGSYPQIQPEIQRSVVLWCPLLLCRGQCPCVYFKSLNHQFSDRMSKPSDDKERYFLSSVSRKRKITSAHCFQRSPSWPWNCLITWRRYETDWIQWLHTSLMLMMIVTKCVSVFSGHPTASEGKHCSHHSVAGSDILPAC